jgi:predicted RNase H-like HicB family nuclease
MTKISVIASWNAEHKVWTATSEDVAGLHVQADTYEELLDIVPDLVGELLTINGGRLAEQNEIPLEILAHYQSTVHIGHQ